jgi:hypothetical protein
MIRLLLWIDAQSGQVFNTKKFLLAVIVMIAPVLLQIWFTANRASWISVFLAFKTIGMIIQVD